MKVVKKVFYEMGPEFVASYEEFFGFSLLYLFHPKWIILFNDLKKSIVSFIWCLE